MKLKGTSADPKRAKVEVELTDDAEDPELPGSKRICQAMSRVVDANGRLEQILDQLEQIEKGIGTLKEVEKKLHKLYSPEVDFKAKI